jgi:hypothetical protein
MKDKFENANFDDLLRDLDLEKQMEQFAPNNNDQPERTGSNSSPQENLDRMQKVVDTIVERNAKTESLLGEARESLERLKTKTQQPRPQKTTTCDSEIVGPLVGLAAWLYCLDWFFPKK